MAMKIKVLFLSIILVLLFNLNIYSMGEANMKNQTIDLVKNFNLNETDKITITTEKFALSYSSMVDEEITDRNTITEIIDALHLVKEVPVCDTRPQYTITFYKDTKQLATLGFFIDDDWYFLRLDSKDGQIDFEPSKHFIEIWKKIQLHK